MPRPKAAKYTGTCAIEGCIRPARKRSWCALHYQRWWATGKFVLREKSPDGTGAVTPNGYRTRMENRVSKLEHIRVAENVLGKSLPKGAQVHHVNGNRLDNRPENLVICPDAAYHKLLHVRQRALEEAGDPNKRKCPFCKEYDDVQNMAVRWAGRLRYEHCECVNEYARQWRKTKAA